MGKMIGRLALSCVFITACFFLTQPALGAQVHGVLTVVKGKVKVKSGKTGKKKRAKAGMKVYPKDTIITKDESRAKIVMVDKNEINISPASEVVIRNYEYDPAKGKKNVLIDVIYGKVRSKVEQKYNGDTSKFQVKTPSAVAGVRGTDFFTSFNRTTKASKVVTFKGEVAFGLPGPNGAIRNPVAVRVGQFTVASNNAPPAPPRAMPQRELAQFDRDTNVGEPPRQDPRAPANEPGRGDKKGEGEGPGPDQGMNGDQNGPRGDQQGERGPDNQAGPDSKGGPGEPGRGPNGGPGDQAGGGMPGGPDVGNPDGSGGMPPMGGGPDMGRDPAGGDMMPPPPPGSGMMLPDDFASADGPMMEPIFDFHPPPMPPPMPHHDNIHCEFCNEHIQDGTTRLIIRVTNGTPGT